MRTIERTSRFKRDYKRESRGGHRRDLDKRLAAIVRALASDEPLEPRHRDHALSGPWADFRDCHIRPDLVLIYEKRTDTRSDSFAWDRTPSSASDVLSAVGVLVPT